MGRFTRHRFLDRRPLVKPALSLDVQASQVFIQDWQWNGDQPRVVKGGFMIVALAHVDAVSQGMIRLKLEGNNPDQWDCILNRPLEAPSQDLIRAALSIESQDEREYREAQYQARRPQLSVVR
jgi:hypothetical protein